MDAKEKLIAIKRLFGDHIVPDRLRFFLGPGFDGKLRPVDYRAIRYWFYRERGIYFGDVSVEEDRRLEEDADSFFIISQRFLVLRKATRFIPSVVIAGEPCPLVGAYSEVGEAKTLDFPLPVSLAEEDKTPTQ